MTDKIYKHDREIAMQGWNEEINGIAPETVVQFICSHTDLIHISTERMLRNGTLAFWDPEFKEPYSLALPQGYVRRGTNVGYYRGSHRIVVDSPLCDPYDGYFAWYQLNKTRKTKRTYGKSRKSSYTCTERIKHPYDAHALAQRLVAAFKVRRNRNYVNNLGHVWPLRKVDWGKKKPSTIEDSMM